jgi:hypothetical protein
LGFNTYCNRWNFHCDAENASDAEKQALDHAETINCIAVYERIVEGKEDVPEIVEPLREHGITSKAEILTGTTFDFDAIISQLHAAQQVWDQHIEADDEDILLLL